MLIRAVTFREEYERQLQQIQLNEQNKLLDQAKGAVAAKQQTLDNFQQGTQAQASSREQDWIKRQAELERAYQVGLIASAGEGVLGELPDATPGAARRALLTMPQERQKELRERAAQVFGIDADSVSEAYFFGIKNLQAETMEYEKRVKTEADAIAARLQAEAAALVAKVQGEYESRVNALLNTPEGRAYVAWKAADNVTFNKTLLFNASDGIPSVLRLRRFAEQFMGQTP